MAASSSALNNNNNPLLPNPIPPALNDITLCHPYYGDTLSPLQCGMAAEALPSSPNPQTYLLRVMGQRYSLPMSITYGECCVSVEAAGPSLPSIINIIPDHIRGFAGWIINQCVIQAGGIGGFLTIGLADLLNFLLNPASDLRAGIPRDTSFFTVTVSGPGNVPIQPGDYDPAIPVALAKALYLKQVQSANRPSRESRFGAMAWGFHSRAMAMQRGTTFPWWTATLPRTEMNYECDSKLGYPSPIDCTNLMSQLGAPSDSILVAPGAVRFLSSSTCHVAISASIALQITWKQIQTALDTLSNFCNYAPGETSQGGRAFFEAQVASLTGKRRMKARGTAISGLNALPPHANITIFQQFEPWQVNANAEMNSCTWKAILQEQNLTSCE